MNKIDGDPSDLDVMDLVIKKEMTLSDCPFCGGDPKIIYTGNNHTKKRKITIKCKQCRVERTIAAFRYDFDWLQKIAAKEWNQRPIIRKKDDLGIFG